jgi:hypothetical protein
MWLCHRQKPAQKTRNNFKNKTGTIIIIPGIKTGDELERTGRFEYKVGARASARNASKRFTR